MGAVQRQIHADAAWGWNSILLALLENLPAALGERVRQLNECQPLHDGQFVLYWMRTAVRAAENPALSTAIDLANQLGLPLLIYHALSERYPYASDRHHTFILEAARDLQSRLKRRFGDRIRYAFHLERPGHRGRHLRTLAPQASVVVTEEMPVEPLRSWTALLARQVSVPVVAVDTACVVPMQLVGKAFDRAFAFRKATQPLYSERLTAAPVEIEPSVAAPDLQLPFVPLNLTTANIAELVSQCDIDHSIGPVIDTIGGATEGYARWQDFKKRGLSSYAKKRNNALLDGVSRMSAYLHYGMVSPQRIARECAELDHAGSEKYLDELLIWRELAYGFCFYRSDHDRLSALPPWAVKSLAEHAQDRREKLHSWETLARGETGELLWDAAQKSLLIHGELHNNVRMTWGKAVLNWTQDAKSALATIVDLNHRYALDGRDPASYGGILWCLGQFDRPFPPAKPITGVVRQRDVHQHAERLDPQKFNAKTTRPLKDSMPSVGVVGAGLSGLICARTLADHGYAVTVFEKSRGCGGRMSTRRAVHENVGPHGLRFDHGAQYFTARDRRFRRYVESWQHDGVVAPWSGRIVVLDRGAITAEKSGTDRYVATPGMNAIGKHLSRDLDVRFETTVSPLSRQQGQWQLTAESGDELGLYDFAVVSAPAFQSARLLENVPALAERAGATVMKGCWALMLAFDQPLSLEFDGAFIGRSEGSEGSAISWIAKNSSKPERSTLPETWVVHSSPEWTERYLEETPEIAQTLLLQEFWKEVGVTPIDPAYATAHRWRFAIPPTPLAENCLFDAEQNIGACGDWCNGPRVEGAFLSGMALAGRIMGTLKTEDTSGMLLCK